MPSFIIYPLGRRLYNNPAQLAGDVNRINWIRYKPQLTTTIFKY